MGPSIVIIFALCGFLSGQPIEPISVEDCCKDGKDRGLQRQDCTALPLISESTTCRIAQEQCCAAVLEDTACTNGINAAKDQGACESLLSESTCETKTAKSCCDCCLLGKAAQEQGLGCDVSLTVGYQCGLVFRACCVDGNPESEATANTTAVPAKGNLNPNEGDDPLLSDQCKGAETCQQRCTGNGTCSCFKGYRMKLDQKNCEDINECLLGSHHCRVGERCINTLGSYRCQREVSCGTGYELTDSNNCKDIDECETGTHNCVAEFECQNTLGSFRCHPRVKCGDGFIQDALGSCIDINECLSESVPCASGQVCLNTVGSYTCQRNTINCGRGYHLNEEAMRCTDVNECSGSDTPCEGHTCINLVGTFRCDCKSGFNFNSLTRTCEDINECRHFPGRLCAHKCENVQGSYECSCMVGFQLAADGRNCNDLNECESNPCSQECANVYGSYQCYCRRGYQLSDIDGITCEDIDECALPTGGHICAYRCDNTPGSFQCTCPSPGYTLASNGRSCQDIDECVTGSHGCSDAETCFNVQGGFRCLSFECPPNYRRAGETSQINQADTVRCVKSCQPNDITCILDPIHSISHTFISLPTFREQPMLEEIVFLRTMSLGQSSTSDIIFNILEGNLQDSFDIIKRFENGRIVGVVRQVKPIIGPVDVALKLAMNYVTSGAVSHQNIVKVNVFISEFWF
ncbi:hypothetical protein ANANG_G00135940 [Anguilla anguilla]|uniref:Fibulin-1 n=1 Tax=Anguilla anguilla TaxID=7936 RepID=A0A9D3M9Z1_ANGAN|nr:hypothetical protein ANANG_G00135940 [Anguilla anguilla]